MTGPNTEYAVETFSGNFVDTRNPDVETINIEDIAHALAHTCRYGGHCKRFYSVAEHAVLVSRRMEELGYSNRRCRAGLHHDDAEAYLGDIPRPMKPLLGARYETLTERMDEAIVGALKLGLNVEMFHEPVVKEADSWALFLEARFLLPSKGINWNAAMLQKWNIDQETLESSRQTPDYWRGGISPTKAEEEFLVRHNELITE